MKSTAREFISALLFICPVLVQATEVSPVIAVAANFVPAVEAINKKFKTDTGHEVRISAGSSGALLRQIEQGAPFELFLSADESYALKLHELGHAQDQGRIYATGRLVLYVPRQSGLNIMQNLEDMLRQLVNEDGYKIAIANPELAPYGAAAEQVLNRYIPYAKLQGRMILGENVGQTAQFALTGSVDAAFLPYALAITPQLQESGHFELLPDDWHNPVHQRMVLLKNAGDVARKFYNYLSSEPARKIILESGYTLPAE
jgi:molybdate transport system substrate-binding protein